MAAEPAQRPPEHALGDQEHPEDGGCDCGNRDDSQPRVGHE
jgi:hypothetical protein